MPKRIIFMGTPDFACPSLQALIDAPDFSVELVVSQPDRERSRHVLSATPVKQLAEANNIPVITPEKLNRQENIDRLIAVNPDFLVVIAFGQMIGRRILDAFPNRIINIHGSLLPAYRGAAPMQRAMLDGLEESGLSAILIEREMDAGDILHQRHVKIEKTDTFATFSERMQEAAAPLLLEVLRDFTNYYEKRRKQDSRFVTFAEKISKRDGALDFCQSGRKLMDQVRTLSDWPGAYFFYQEKRYKVHAAHLEPKKENEAPGTIWSVGSDGIKINAKDASFVIDHIQAPNRKEMSVSAFLAGHTFETGVL